MQHKSAINLLVCILAVIGMASCDSNKNDAQSDFDDQYSEDDFSSIAAIVGDSFNGNKVSKECAVICYRIDKVEDKIDRVVSPSTLINIKKEYLESLKSAESGNENLIESEQAIVQSRISEVEAEYKKACRDYEVPASGVIYNLKDLIEQIDKVKNRSDFDSFQNCRYGILHDLDNIHLCVEQGSNKIPEVKRLAQTLKSKYESKKKELGID